MISDVAHTQQLPHCMELHMLRPEVCWIVSPPAVNPGSACVIHNGFVNPPSVTECGRVIGKTNAGGPVL